MPEMCHEIAIDYEKLTQGRAGSRKSRPEYARWRWPERLAKERHLPGYAVTDLLADVLPFWWSCPDKDLIEQLTGERPVPMMRHPGRRSSTWGGDYWPSATVGIALVVLARLGVPIDAAALTAPLRKRLSRTREYPLLTHTELNLLWSRIESSARTVHLFRWPASSGAAAIEPYAVALTQGRVAVGFADLDGRRVEVIGSPGSRRLYGEALGAWCSLSRTEFTRLARSAQAPRPLARETGRPRLELIRADSLLPDQSNGDRDVGSACQ